MITNDYQNLCYTRLKVIFGEANVKKEWDVAKNSQDDLTRNLYCPRLDLAIGPFNIDGEIEHNQQQINEEIQRHSELIDQLIDVSQNYTGGRQEFLNNRNSNPRCLISVEIEDSGSRKHMLGDIANTSILGAIGIVVPLNQAKLEAFKKIMKYIHFARAVGKLKQSFANVLLINKEDFLRLISI